MTPRVGFPVEIEALWIKVLGASIEILGQAGRPTDEWNDLLHRAMLSFPTLLDAAHGGLVDVVDQAGNRDESNRPNYPAVVISYG